MYHQSLNMLINNFLYSFISISHPLLWVKQAGYLTAESTRAASSDRCRGRSPAKSMMKATRLSRSLSRTKVPKNVTIQMPEMETSKSGSKTPPPEKRMPGPNSYYITPKVGYVYYRFPKYFWFTTSLVLELFFRCAQGQKPSQQLQSL